MELSQILTCLKCIVLSDRYNKRDEECIQGLDFTRIRNLLNKYSKKNCAEFISEPPNAFLYLHFNCT